MEMHGIRRKTPVAEARNRVAHEVSDAVGLEAEGLDPRYSELFE